MRCQAIVKIDRDTGDQFQCEEEATFQAYEPPIYFCSDCLHDCMEDASPEETSTVKRLTLEP